MGSDVSNAVAALRISVLRILDEIGGIRSGAYPVLGAEGTHFFIELAAGPLESRQILKTIHVEIRRKGYDQLAPQNSICVVGNEIAIILPDESFLIALVGLFQSALKTSASILHPLDSSGNFLPGWNDAVIAVSPERPS